MSLTRPQFESACKAYVQKYSFDCHGRGANDNLLKKYPTGWSWNEHKSVPGLGHLARLTLYPTGTSIQRDSGNDVEEDTAETEADPAEGSVAPDVISCRQYVVFSSTYQVPAFYFSMHHKTGSPLTLQEITASRLFRSQALPATDMTAFAIGTTDSAFAMLSQGDHPTLGTPCWYLHPCHTAEVVEEIMREVDHTESDRSLRWLEAWFMVLCNLVDFGDVGR